MMRIVFLGASDFSRTILEHLVEKRFAISAVFAIPEEFTIKYDGEAKRVNNSRYADLRPLAESHGIPYYEVEHGRSSTKLTAYYNVIEKIAPTVILVMGWYYIVPRSIRDLANYGAWGIHASLLPKYGGGAPLVWAMIEGEKETGVTLYRLEDGIDNGPIIAQKAFTISDTDTIQEVLDKSIEVSKEILSDSLNRFNEIVPTEQDKDQIEVYPQRKPEDGEIDWSQSAEQIQNFIRAQTHPYPGAYTFINGKKVIIWDADIIENDSFSNA